MMFYENIRLLNDVCACVDTLGSIPNDLGILFSLSNKLKMRRMNSYVPRHSNAVCLHGCYCQRAVL